MENYNDTISETIPLNSNIQYRSVRIYIKWDDNESTQSMSNLQDAESTASTDPVTFNVTLDFTQLRDSASDNDIN